MNTRDQNNNIIVSTFKQTGHTCVKHTFKALAIITLIAGTAQADPVFHQDAQRTGRSSFIGPSVPMVKWTFPTNGSVTSSPAVGEDGTIYVGSFDTKLYAINPDGTQKWNYPTGLFISSSPGIGDTKSIYFGSYDGWFYAVKPDASLLWKLQATPLPGVPGSSISSSPVFDTNGNVLFAVDFGRVFSVNQATGVVNWSTPLPAGTSSSPAIGQNGRIYIGCNNGKLYAINPDGTVAWSYATNNPSGISPSVASDGTVYMNSLDGYLYAVNPDGTLKWRYLAPPGSGTTPAIGWDGTVYLAGADSNVHAIDPDTGQRKWLYHSASPIFSSILVDGASNLYFGNNTGQFYSLKSDGSVNWYIATGATIYSSPTIDSTGTIYFGGNDKKVWAIGPVPEPTSILTLGSLLAGALTTMKKRRKC